MWPRLYISQAPAFNRLFLVLISLVMVMISCSSSSSSSFHLDVPTPPLQGLSGNVAQPTFQSSSSGQHAHHHHHHHHHHRYSRRHYRQSTYAYDRDAIVNVFTVFDPSLSPSHQNHTSTAIQRLIVDPNSGSVYVGASNFLYQLTSQLAVVHNVTTGPLMDNPYCPPPHSSCECLISGCKEEKPTSTDSIVRTMVMDQKDRKLIVCYSLFKGHCRKYLLGNISVAETPRYTMMVPSDENSSVVMFIAPGPPNPASTDVLYIATTRSNKGLMAYKDSVPTICTRNIQDFEFVSSDILVPSKIDVEIQQREIFKVHYVHGFSSLGFSYFLSLQKTSVKNVTMDRLVSRISRICHGDKTLYSYTEIPLECWVPEPQSPNGLDSGDTDDDEFGRRSYSVHSQRQRPSTNYNVLLAATIVKPGSLLAKRLGLSDVPPMSELEDVLVGAFGAQDPHNISSTGSSATINGNINDNIGANPGNHDSGVGPGAALPGTAICIYPMRDVRRIFTETIQSCFEGIGNIGPDHFVQPIPCKTAKFEITDEYCGEYDVNHPIIGSNPITSTAAILLDGVKVTSLAATTANDETVIFMGTDIGDVRKIKINSDKDAQEYDKISVERGIPVGRDLSFDPQHKHLYAFLNRTVYRLAVERCSTYQTCGQCIGAGDPYCGWCSLQKRCTAKDECSDSNLSLRWLSSGSCARILKVVSNQAQKISNSTSLVIMTVQNLPVSVSGQYFCSFSGHGVTRQTTANITMDRNHGNDRYGGNVTLKCETPRSNLLPPFPTGKDHILMTLSLTSDDLDHLTTNFTFFDCSVHNSCTKCTTSSYPCTWCTQSNRCTGNKEDCMTDRLITGVKVPGISDTPGPAYCPRIENIITNSSEILIPSGSEMALRVRVIHHQPFQSPLRCSFNFNGGHEVGAILVDHDVIECEPIKFEYSSSTHFRNVPFGITWGDGGKKNLDNPTNVQVRIYKCQEMASNCGRCRAVDLRLNCGWCRRSSGEECTTRSWCSGPNNSWMLHSQPCRDAYVIDIFPRKGPLEGGTLLTVKGENLGLEPHDTVVNIGGLPCRVIQYDPSIEFVCETMNSSKYFGSSLAITVSHNVTFSSDVHFSYVRSELFSIHPPIGPKSGGSILTISGHNLDSGSNITVMFSSKLLGVSTPCIVKDRSSDWLKCMTMTSPLTYTADLIEVVIDQSHIGLDLESGLFTFVTDPIITHIDSKKAVMSGGNLINVRGERLSVVSSPRMAVYKDDDMFTSPCMSVSDTEMICLFPNVTSSRSIPLSFHHHHHHHKQNKHHLKAQDPPKLSTPMTSHPRKSREAIHSDQPRDQPPRAIEEANDKGRTSDVHKSRDDKSRSSSPMTTVDALIFNYGFIMDGVKSLLNFSDTFQVYPDPEIEVFEDGMKKEYSNKLEHFTINGYHLNLALSKEDYRVTIGGEECEVTSLSPSYLMCSMKHIYNLPSSAEVKVFVGNTTVHKVGTLEHDGLPKSPLTSMPFLVGIGSSAFLVVIVVVIICWCYRVKTKRNTRVMKRLKNQMDILESRVAKECKEAFAELQTDMTEVTQDFLGKIPFRDYRSFCANVLFPGVSLEHQVFKWGTGTGLPPNLLPATSTSQLQHLQHQPTMLQQQLDTSYSTTSSIDPLGVDNCLLAFSPNNTGRGFFGRSAVHRDHVLLDTSGKGAKTLSKLTSESNSNTLNNSSTSFISSVCLNLSRESLKEMEGLLLNRSFLLTLITTLESRKDFIVREKVNFASLLSVALQPFMDYHTDILKTLLSDLIERAMEKQNHPKLLLRRTESVAEKMLTNWFAFLLYKFLKDRAGEKLFMLFRAVKQQVEKGPVDQITSEARYSLSEEKLIRQQVDFKVMTLQVVDPEGSTQQTTFHQVKVLDCDTISQAKEKILDVVFRHSGFSTRPSKDGLDIEWMNPRTSQSLILQDEDDTNDTSGEYKKLNTLAHYRLPDQAVVSLVMKQNIYYNPHHKFENFSGSLPSSYSLSHNIPLVAQSSVKTCHLVKSNEHDNHKDDRGSKMVSEVYLTRLLATKGTLQSFVDDLFQTIFSCDSTSPVNQQNSLLPLAIKYMFDFFDDQATHHGICDPEVVHTWKSNSLPLRFWVNIVKNPDFVFDIHKSNIVDSCLSVIGQTFMDSCCMSDHKLSKDSPSSKLLYAKDIPKYKSWVIKYYEDIKQMPSLSEHEMMEVLKQESMIHQNEFNTEESLREISRYVFKYYNDFTQALSEDEFCRRDRLSERLDAIHRRSSTT